MKHTSARRTRLTVVVIVVCGVSWQFAARKTVYGTVYRAGREALHDMSGAMFKALLQRDIVTRVCVCVLNVNECV